MYNSQNTSNITAKKMCEECKIGVNSLSNIRRGDIKSIETFMIIADYLDCSVDYLLGRTDNPQSHKMPVQRKPFSGVRPATIAAYGHETMGIDEKE